MAIQEYQQKSIAVLNDYPPEKYNLLIPVQTIQEISPLHRVIVNIVTIDPDPERGKDVYKQKNGEYALTKKGINKLMAAANIQVIDSRTVLTQKCQRCAEMARQTKLAPRCGDCPSGDDVACQVVVAIPDASGTWRMVKATKELRIADEKVAMTEAQFKQFLPYRSEHAETKAILRAIRAGLTLKSTYRAAELKLPFAVALVVPNMADPDMRKAATARLASSSMALFPGQIPQLPENAGELKQLPAGAMEVIPPDEGDDDDSQQGPPGDNPPWLSGEEEGSLDNGFFCNDCGQKILAVADWSAEKISEYSAQRYGKSLCPDCQNKYKAQQGGGRR